MELLLDPITINSRKVLAGFKLIGADYSIKKVDFFKGEYASPEYVAINPMASVPTLRDGEFTLWESNCWFASCYVFVVENCVKPLLGDKTDPNVLANEEPRFHKLAAILDTRLQNNTFLCREEPTIADVAIAAPMHIHEWFKLPLKEHPNLVRWMTENIEKSSWWMETHVKEGFALPD